MAVAEARFYDDSDYKGALAGYDEVLKFPDSPLYDLALFKTAWCYWKLGDPDRAARRFKEVLDLGSGARQVAARAHQFTEEGRKRLEELKGEALDYLVQVFTEDERKGPKDAFDFLASIGGARYSRKVIAQAGRHVLLAGALRARHRVASASSSSSTPTTRATRIGRSASSRRCARWTRTRKRSRSCASWPRATGRAASGRKAQQNPQAVEHAHKLAADMLREVAKELARRRAAQRAAAEGAHRRRSLCARGRVRTPST